MKNAIKKRIFVFVILISCISGMFAQINAIKDKSVFSKVNLSSANKNIESEEVKDKSVFSKVNLSSANKNIESEEVVVKETFIPNAQMAMSSPVSVDLSEQSSFIPNAQMAMSSPDYLVTAGDVYTLAFAMGTTPVSYTMTVDSSYKIRVANLGIVNAKGLSFLQLKSQVEAIVSKNYPMGGVQFVLLSPAMFNVKVSGDVSSSTEAPAWALSRLSTVVVPLFTDYSSSRDIQVISADGTKKVYDLFLAERNGDFSNNPYLRPGDNIIVSEAKRKVRIDGAVKRPGVYELLDGENLNALVEKYGDGLTPYADTSRIDLLRITNEPEAGKMYYFKDDAIKSDISIDAYDYVKINSYEDLRAAMFIEGAIAKDVISEDLEGVVRRTIHITNGEKYSDLIQRYKHLFTATSDLVNAYIIRTDPESESKLAKTRNIPINLEKILFDVNYYDSEVVCPNDVLIVPFRQFFVSVAGAVVTPGRFPYIPDRDWNYYVGLAGGIDTFKNAFKSVEITDKDGNLLKKDDLIPPEATITVKSNNAFYKWNQVAGGVTAILTAISTVLSIYMIATNQ